ncbi:MAG: 50S ribosomal protein L22 [bacterium]|nr:50S ribosomal protein L22 [bacterium]MDZ4248426.1 50S ribosomal protein L22 [Patescibacteria group bacterium]
MEVTAKARFQRGSARKARLILEPLRGARAEEALARLRLAPHAAARPVAKLIASAVANAEHNHSLDKSSLVIETLTADQGPSYKRYRPGAKGRANPIRRPSMHVTVTLKAVAAAGTAGKAAKPAKAKQPKKTAVKKISAKEAPKQESKVTSSAETAKPKDQTSTQGTGTQKRKPDAPRKTDRQTGVNAKSTKGKGG